MTTPFRAVLFDFGGTLFSYLPLRARFTRLLTETAYEHGIRTEPPELLRTFAEASSAVGSRFLERPFYLHRDFFGDCGEAFVRALGGEPAPGLRERFYLAQTEVARPLIEPREGARDTLRGLRSRGLHVGVVSNIDDDQFEVLWELCGLDGEVDARTTSEEARSCKPHPEIFRRALEKGGGLEPQHTLFVGDSLPHDAAGARALGMPTAYIGDRTLDAGSAEQTDWVLERLADVLDVVDGAHAR